MKRNIEVTTYEGIILGNALWYYITESSVHPIDLYAAEKLKDRIIDIISSDLPNREVDDGK